MAIILETLLMNLAAGLILAFQVFNLDLYVALTLFGDRVTAFLRHSLRAILQHGHHQAYLGPKQIRGLDRIAQRARQEISGP